ncbi:related to glyoxalase family protein [Phialocephala subalpina]|uniref:Related to glyoxalase family protein n=1 Tax=Phialocephala subalpina TaxID=576137 RepID=A0A1L7XTB3_9HELO|nr:related to glyoxalase family protein [Phialocephala subalpina]
MGLITGIAHVNVTVPPGTLEQAAKFYGETLGLTRAPVPALQKETLAWFDITPGGQQIHVSSHSTEGTTTNDFKASRHPCFKLGSREELQELRERIWKHFESKSEGSPSEADKPGEEASGAKGVEYPTRFFARDYAGNRLEFSL